MKQNNILPKAVITQILCEYGIAMTNSTLRMLVEEKMGPIPTERWNQIVKEISEVSGMILED